MFYHAKKLFAGHIKVIGGSDAAQACISRYSSKHIGSKIFKQKLDQCLAGWKFTKLLKKIHKIHKIFVA